MSARNQVRRAPDFMPKKLQVRNLKIGIFSFEKTFFGVVYINLLLI
jgi:hypothetical protein